MGKLTKDKKVMQEIHPKYGINLRYTVPTGIPPTKIEKAHNDLIQFLSMEQVKTYTSKSFKQITLIYLSLPESERLDYKLALLNKESTSRNSNVGNLQGLWQPLTRKYDSDSTHPQHKEIIDSEEVWSIFFRNRRIYEIGELNDNLIQDFINWRYTWRRPNDQRQSPVSDKQIKKELRWFKKALELYSIRNDLREPKIFYDLKFRKIRKDVRSLEIPEVEKLLQFTYTLSSDWAGDMILFLLNTGMRASEVDKMTQSDWNLELKVLKIGDPERISGQNQMKTESANRFIDISPVMEKLYRRGLIFQSDSKVAVRLGCILRRKRATPIPTKASVHQLRHTHATWLLRAGVKTIIEISEELGHSQSSFTHSVYTNTYRGAKRREEIKQEHLRAYQRYFIEFFD